MTREYLRRPNGQFAGSAAGKQPPSSSQRPAPASPRGTPPDPAPNDRYTAMHAAYLNAAARAYPAPDGYDIGIELVEPGDPDDPAFPDLLAAHAAPTGQPGCGQATFTVNHAARRVTIASDIWIDPEHRRRGLASSLIHAIEAAYPGYDIDPNGFTDDGLAFWTGRHRAAPPPPATRTVQTLHGPATVTCEPGPDGQYDPATRHAYLNGQCFALAVQLAGPDGTVGVLIRDSDLPWATEYHDPEHLLDLDHSWFADATHAVALTGHPDDPGSVAVDIDGPRDLDALRAEHEDVHAGTMITMPAGALRSLTAGTSHACPQDYDTAALIAAHIKPETS